MRYLDWHEIEKTTNGQTDKRTNRQMDKQTNGQTDKWKNRQTEKCKNGQTDKQTNRQTGNRQTGNRQIDKQTKNGPTDKRTNRQTDKGTMDYSTYRDRQMDKWTNGQTNGWSVRKHDANNQQRFFITVGCKKLSAYRATLQPSASKLRQCRDIIVDLKKGDQN